MGKVDFNAALTSDGGVAFGDDTSEVCLPRWNICTADGVYFTTIRAESEDQALKQAKAANPDVELVIQPPYRSRECPMDSDEEGEAGLGYTT